ncbi:LOW QUALITY PROTEIN: hypothetical protein PanWU01x14_276450 [Parasponia andersonii]|uniref:Transmembrane protein n=1 Tax=Parasponia andersonii TaxID=3476 RepID=A0A2P5B304_PARAD|nr:LOW QUALITY PROTEIN: hypothetical protein PanWU01x14_276450 [Parasponia andersonii]
MVIVVVPVRRRRLMMRRRYRSSGGHLIRRRRRREFSLLGGFPFGKANAREDARLLLAIRRCCCRGGCSRSSRRDRGFGRGFRGRPPGGLGSPAVMMVVVVALAVVVVVVPVLVAVPITLPVVELIGLSLGRTWRFELSRRSLNG